MKLSPEIQAAVSNATSRALATSGPQGLNVVPLSMARANEDSVWLFNFFMNKTVENLKANPEAALSCWQGLAGVQLRGSVEYVTDGERFEAAVAWVATQNADRVVRGLWVLTPRECFDVSAGPNAGRPLSS